MSNAKPFANVPVLSHLLCTKRYSFSVLFFSFFFFSWRCDNDCKAEQFIINSSCIFVKYQMRLAPQSTQWCFLMHEVWLMYFLSTNNDKLYWEMPVLRHPEPDARLDQLCTAQDAQKNCPFEAISLQVFLLFLEQSPTFWVVPFSACRKEEALLGHWV